ncbi:hypothetical protein C7C46_12085 [Streptomyces tateyamensis]|uniref:Uncharacterized protein n=1 Tax=Streptomyces tateyamensis TaxID=565073 RepID=A0A2V4NW58_9ACTN|nr:hypothetical protein [Streptomyces tateyamensis]PYC80877.1 hypothetical protein C7C46_12085 [Streptomyces tateyamensis]
MITSGTYEQRRPVDSSGGPDWSALLADYRRTRAEAFARGGERVAAEQVAALGHMVALGAPAPIAAALFDPAAGPGAAAGEQDNWVGPLWEVLAVRHLWRELAALPIAGPVRTLVAHTRVLLGEDLAGERLAAAPPVLHPWEQAGWEVGDRVTEYRAGGAAATPHFPLPESREGLTPVALPPAVPPTVAGWPATAALGGLCEWVSARCVRGTAAEAAALFAAAESVGEPGGPPGGSVTGGYLPFAAAYPALVRAGSGAGAYGRSGGAARGRVRVWRALAAMADPSGECSPAEVDALVARMRCYTWCAPADEVWYLHLALEDPATGLAWAVSGSDYD